MDTNAQIPDATGKVLVEKGQQRTLTGPRRGGLRHLPGPGRDADAPAGPVRAGAGRAGAHHADRPPDATDDVHRMNAVLDPSLPEKALAGLLVELAQQAQAGTSAPARWRSSRTARWTRPPPVRRSRTCSAAPCTRRPRTTPGPGQHVDASGNDQSAAAAQIQVVNAGLNFVPGGGKAPAPQATSEIHYTDDARAGAAQSLATSLGLPATAVKKVTDAQIADLVVVLGKDYQAPKL